MCYNYDFCCYICALFNLILFAMSKGNMLLGYARGKVGDVVFSRVKGQQITKARNRRPANPRTYLQMYQRALFASSVLFYQFARANFFKFAFEDKGYHESDYNAFMRHNVNRGTLISKAAFDTRTYLPLGNWLLSYGSLSGFDYDVDDITLSWNTGIEITSDALPKTVGDLSTLLIDKEDYLVGDMITYVSVHVSFTNGANEPEVYPNAANYTPHFYFNQFLIDPGDTRPLENVAMTAGRGGTNNTLQITPNYGYSEKIFGGVAFIRTRVDGDKIKASTSQLVLTKLMETAIDKARQNSYIFDVLVSWGANENAILDPRSLDDRGGIQSKMAAPVSAEEGEMLVDAAVKTRKRGTPTVD